MQNQEEKIRKIVEEIQGLISDLNAVNSYSGVVCNFFKINDLYEKSVFIKNIAAYQLSIPEQLNENTSHLLAEPLIQNDEILEKTVLQEAHLEEENVIEIDQSSNEVNFDAPNSSEMEVEAEEDILVTSEIEINEKPVEENQVESFILDNVPVESLESSTTSVSENAVDDAVSEEKRMENLKISLVKLKDKMAVSLPDEELQLKEKFNFTNDEKTFYIKELFNDRFEDWNTTMQKLVHINKIENASAYLSEIYYSKKWDKKEVIAQRFWQKIEKAF